ncbi:hypothetical protein CHS0354_036005 [Potamilus streckersoni]|uniref:Ig-like domain-containing protein n=1 Tax=Potamilus streckersoni TaxID=2493646 RepID=A0AAE0SE93_9BIVA|nr:hypothetical protein CHS0354_036005 [Potamilus streckersoni]
MEIPFCSKSKMPWVIFILIVLHTRITSGNIIVSPKVPEVNQTATISCFVPAPRYWLLPEGAVICSNGACEPDSYGSYTFRADSSKTEFIFQSLNRSRDERMWTCKQESANYNISLLIYFIIEGVHLESACPFGVMVSIWSQHVHLNPGCPFGVSMSIWSQHVHLESGYPFEVSMSIWSQAVLLESRCALGVSMFIWSNHQHLESPCPFGVGINHVHLRKAGPFGVSMSIWSQDVNLESACPLQSSYLFGVSNSKELTCKF